MILVTGGAGYIGSHVCVELLQAGQDVAVLDNFSNSRPESLARVQRITGKAVRLFEGDIRDRAYVAGTLRDCGASAVIHLAGLKAVGESMQQPLRYYDHNVGGTVQLLAAMAATEVKTLVFSSSATVYGEPQFLPYTERHPLAAKSVYGRSKLVIEDMLRDVFHSAPDWHIGILRYFNPIGAHASGLIGEDPRGVPNNLLPFVAQVATGRRSHVDVCGYDYATPDGTGIRDYLHVVDLALGHVKALQTLSQGPQCFALNLGTGTGVSVLELVAAFTRASGRPIPCHMTARRDGDLESCYSDPALAGKMLGWRATRDLATMCEDTWRWARHNPQGYASAARAH